MCECLYVYVMCIRYVYVYLCIYISLYCKFAKLSRARVPVYFLFRASSSRIKRNRVQFKLISSQFDLNLCSTQNVYINLIVLSKNLTIKKRSKYQQKAKEKFNDTKASHIVLDKT